MSRLLNVPLTEESARWINHKHHMRYWALGSSVICCCSSGVFRGDSGGDPPALPALQLSRLQLHLETWRGESGHEQDARREQRPRRRPRAPTATTGPRPLHPRHPPPLQRWPHWGLTCELIKGRGLSSLRTADEECHLRHTVLMILYRLLHLHSHVWALKPTYQMFMRNVCYFQNDSRDF